MKFRIGDKVRFLNDVGGGKIVRIIDERTVSVLNEDGFEVPTLAKEIIIVDSTSDQKIGFHSSSDEAEVLNQSKKQTLQSKQEKVNPENNSLLQSYAGIDDIDDEEGDDLGLYIAFVPKDQLNTAESGQNLYLINDSTYRILYIVGRWNSDRNAVEPIHTGLLLPDCKEKVKEFTQKELNTPVAINIQALFFKNLSFIAQQPEFFDLEINPVKFYRPGSFTENDFFEENAMVFTITDTQKEHLLKSLTNNAIEESIKQKDIKPKPEVSKVEPELMEVDLHIHEIVDNHSSLKPGEILEIQLARFTNSLETGLKSKSTRKMVFIHGLGNGKLKNEVIRKLQKEYPKLRFQDASFKEYGYGATLVFLR